METRDKDFKNVCTKNGSMQLTKLQIILRNSVTWNKKFNLESTNKLQAVLSELISEHITIETIF